MYWLFISHYEAPSTCINISSLPPEGGMNVWILWQSIQQLLRSLEPQVSMAKNIRGHWPKFRCKTKKKIAISSLWVIHTPCLFIPSRGWNFVFYDLSTTVDYCLVPCMFRILQVDWASHIWSALIHYLKALWLQPARINVGCFCKSQICWNFTFVNVEIKLPVFYVMMWLHCAYWPVRYWYKSHLVRFRLRFWLKVSVLGCYRHSWRYLEVLSKTAGSVVTNSYIIY